MAEDAAAMTVEECQAFADHMRRFRQRYGLKQRDLAARWNVSYWTVLNLERCVIAPFPRTITRLQELELEYQAAERKEMDELTGTS